MLRESFNVASRSELLHQQIIEEKKRVISINLWYSLLLFGSWCRNCMIMLVIDKSWVFEMKRHNIVRWMNQLHEPTLNIHDTITIHFCITNWQNINSVFRTKTHLTVFSEFRLKRLRPALPHYATGWQAHHPLDSMFRIDNLCARRKRASRCRSVLLVGSHRQTRFAFHFVLCISSPSAVSNSVRSFRARNVVVRCPQVRCVHCESVGVVDPSKRYARLLISITNISEWFHAAIRPAQRYAYL